MSNEGAEFARNKSGPQSISDLRLLFKDPNQEDLEFLKPGQKIVEEINWDPPESIKVDDSEKLPWEMEVNLDGVLMKCRNPDGTYRYSGITVGRLGVVEKKDGELQIALRGLDEEIRMKADQRAIGGLLEGIRGVSELEMAFVHLDRPDLATSASEFLGLVLGANELFSAVLTRMRQGESPSEIKRQIEEE